MLRHPADRHGQGLRDRRRGRRRGRVTRLRQHPLRAARPLLPRPLVGAHHRLEGRAGAVLRPGQADARRGREPRQVRRRRPDGEGRRRDGGGGHVPPHARRRVLRRPGAGARRDRARPVLRRRRAGPQGVPELRGVHDRLPAPRQEHPGEELPLPRRAGRRRGASAHHGDARAAAGGRRLPDRRAVDQGEGVAAPGGEELHRRPRRVRRGRRSAPRSCCTGSRPRATCPCSRTASVTSRGPTPSRSWARSRPTPASTTAGASRSRRPSIPTSTPMSSRCATARAPTSCPCCRPCSPTATSRVRGGRPGCASCGGRRARLGRSTTSSTGRSER